MRFFLASLAFFLLHLNSFATWSIIMVDPKTKEIGIAGASCTYSCTGIGKIIPGKGAIIVQAMSNNEARREGLRMIVAGASPEIIIQALKDPFFDPERQQYAIVTINNLDTPATYTGSGTLPYGGSLTGKGISVQGGALPDERVLKAVMAAALEGQKEALPIEEILMRALEAGSAAGGDRRCGEQRAMSAFLLVAKPTDKLRRPYLNLQFFGQKQGGMNAVYLLRGKYEKWKKKHSG